MPRFSERGESRNRTRRVVPVTGLMQTVFLPFSGFGDT